MWYGGQMATEMIRPLKGGLGLSISFLLRWLVITGKDIMNVKNIWEKMKRLL